MGIDSKKWYFRTYVYVILFLCVGPFALPLVWINPRYALTKRIVLTIITLIASYVIFVMLAKSTESIHSYYQQILELSK
ncbi:MAG: hypothetical protein HZA72_00630 [Candidatus Omnitrophica bacterium]|nr:hypothetical protein [Candidatus Omnitrophota bacterium]